MSAYQYRNPERAGEELIVCEIFVNGEWIPYAAGAGDPEPRGAATYAQIIADYEGQTIPDRVVAPVVPQEVTKLQLVRALRAAGLWEGADGFKAMIAAADAETQEDWELAQIMPRNDAMIVAMATAAGKTSAEIDAVFIAARSL